MVVMQGTTIVNTETRKLILIGGGGHCRSVADSVDAKAYSDIVIVDHHLVTGSIICGYRVVGGDDILGDLYDADYKEAFISVGSLKDTTARRRIYDRAMPIGFSFPSILDQSVAVAVDVSIGYGIFVGKNAVINAGSRISDFVIINTGAIVEHDCIIGKFTHISVGAVVCGGCKVANDVFIGANATVIQEVKIGANSVIGAGSTVLADVPENTVVTGVWGGV